MASGLPITRITDVPTTMGGRMPGLQLNDYIETQRLLGCTGPTVDRLVAEGLLPEPFMLRGKRWWTTPDIETCLAVLPWRKRSPRGRKWRGEARAGAP